MKHLIDLLDRGELYDIFRNFGDMSGLGVSLRDLEGKELMSYYKDGRVHLQHDKRQSDLCKECQL